MTHSEPERVTPEMLDELHRVMHTDEEVMIAKSVCRVLGLPIEKDNEHGNEDEKA